MRYLSVFFAAGLCVIAFLGFPLSTHASPRFTSDIELSGDMGLGGLAGGACATFHGGVDIQERNLGLGLLGRVRFSSQEASNNGYIYRRDWDEVTDYVHIWRYFNYRHSFGTIYFQTHAGELLNYTLGHGSLVRAYSNLADPDHLHSGLQFQFESERWGMEGMVDNFVNPSLVALRVDAHIMRRVRPLAIGVSLAIDPRAPLDVLYDTSNQRSVDSAYNLQVTTQPLSLMGLDIEYTWENAARGRLTPYLDLGTSFYGLGFHTGASGKLIIEKTSRISLEARLEYRLSSDSYRPAYFETFYDVERYQASLSINDPEHASSDLSSPKLSSLKNGVYGGHGLSAQIGLDIPSRVRFNVGFDRHPGPDANVLRFHVSTHPIAQWDLGFFLLARGVGAPYGSSNALVAIAESHYRLTKHLYALAQYTRTWSLDNTSRYYSIVQSFNVGVGTGWSD